MGIELSPEESSSNIVYLPYREKLLPGKHLLYFKDLQIKGTIVALIRCGEN